MKYGPDEVGWCTWSLEGSHGIGLWKAIHKEANLFKKNGSYMLGNGTKIRFWEDTCCGEVPSKIKTLFLLPTPLLFHPTKFNWTLKAPLKVKTFA